MAEVTVRQFAEVVGISIDRLLDQLKEAGVSVSDADATISDEEKMELLGFLRNKHASDEKAATEPKKITLKRKSTSELKTTTSQGRSKAVTVEVRKKRTYVKRSVVMEKEQEELEKAREEQARLEAEQSLPYKFVVEQAYPSEKKAYPKKSYIVIVSTFASLLFALIVLIIIDNIKARVAIQEEK